MAVKNKKLRIAYNMGEIDGKIKVSNKTYSYINPNAEDQALLEAGQALTSLQDKEVYELIKIEESVLG